MACAVFLSVLWMAVALPKVADSGWFSGDGVRAYLAKTIKITGPADRPVLPGVDYALYAGGANRLFALLMPLSSAVAVSVFLAELGTGVVILLGVIARRRTWRRAGVLVSASLCLALGVSGASRLTAVMFALAVGLLAFDARSRP